MWHAAARPRNLRRKQSMQHDPTLGVCPDFAAVVRAALPVSSSSHERGVRARFLDDVARSYKSQHVTLDMEDLEVVFRGVQSPALGVGTAAGEHRARLAAQQAFREAGGRAAAHALIVLAFPPRDRRFGEPKVAFASVREHMDPDTFILLGAFEDERLARGTMRVSVLLG